MSTLFLDIDGVLNGHEFDSKAESSRIKSACVDELNFVLEQTACDLVISSAWRYMVLRGAMTLKGFEYMLRTHGVRCIGKVVGVTDEDRQLEDPLDRSNVISLYVAKNLIQEYAVVDDLLIVGHPFVRTDPKVGLTAADARRLVELLK